MSRSCSVKRWLERNWNWYSFLLDPCCATTYWSVAMRLPFLPSKTYGLPVEKPEKVRLCGQL